MDKKMKHAIVVLAHDDMPILVRLINSFDDDFDFYIHIDQDWIEFNESAIRKNLYNSHVVKFFCWRHVKWGSMDIIKTQMRLIDIALTEKPYDYIHLMSGHDILLRSSEEVKDFFYIHNGEEFIDYHQLPFLKWEKGTFARLNVFGLYDVLDYNKKGHRRIIEAFIRIQKRLGYKRNIPTQYPRLFGGSNWMSLTGNCWKYILKNYNKSFLRRLRFTFASDEVFYHSVVMNSGFGLKATGYNLRLINWSPSGAVKTLTKHDWWGICKSKAFIARKVYTGISNELVEWIEQCRDQSEDPMNKISHKTDQMRRVDSEVEYILKRIVDGLTIKSSCEFLCNNGIYVRLLRDNKVNAHGFDVYEETAELTQRLFPSGFHCQTANLYEPIKHDFYVDLSLVLVNWVTDNINSNMIFLSNLASVSIKYILIRGLYDFSNNQDNDSHFASPKDMKAVDALMENYGFSRNVTVSRILQSKIEVDNVKEDLWLFYEKRNLLSDSV